MAAPFYIGDRPVGTGHPCFVIAEIGVNHNGDPELARALIDAAHQAGADAVKFQTFQPRALAATNAPKAAYQELTDRADSQLDMLSRLVLTKKDHQYLKVHAQTKGITFLSSPFDEDSVALLQQLEVPAFKIPSGEITNLPLLRRIASIGQPIILSTGMSTLEEVEEALTVIRQAGTSAVALLHCVSCYPAAPADCNLRAMETMRSAFDVPVGWSDHTEGIAVAIAAVALGASIVEKHVTLCRDLPGPDHPASLEPDELSALVAAVRTAEAAVGSAIKQPVAAEIAIARVARKSLHWRFAQVAGHIVTGEDIIALRPGNGISPAQLGRLLGKRLRADVAAESLVRLEDVD